VLTFAVVTSRTGGALPQTTLDMLRNATAGGIDSQLATPVEDRILWINSSSTTAAIAWWSGHNPFDSGRLWHDTRTSFTALSGHGWPRGKGWDWTRPWAPQLADHLDGNTSASHVVSEDAFRQFSGVFAACHLTEHGGTIFADPFGLGLIHHGTNRHVEVFSSRAAIAAHLLAPPGTTPERSAFDTGWLAFGQVMAADTSSFAGVDVLPQCTRVEIRPDGSTRARTITHPAHWHPDGLSPTEAVELIHNDLTAELTAISTMRGLPLVCDLTGGKDSRLILSLALEAGIADRFEYFTSGPEDLPDVRIAQQLRDRYGLKGHPVAQPKPPESEWNRREPSGLWETYQQFSFATAGMQTLWSHRRLGSPRQRISVNGIGGEPLYTNYPGSAQLRRPSQLRNFIRDGQKFGRTDTCLPDARRHYEDLTDQLVEELSKDCDSVQDAVDKYYLRVRMRRWFGTGQEVDRTNRIFPLLGAPAIAAAFGLGHELRQSQYVIFEILNRVDRALVTIPFADDTWPFRLVQYVDTDGISSAAIGNPLSQTQIYADDLAPKLNATHGYRAKRLLEQIDLFKKVMTDDPGNPLFTVTDHKATVDLIDNYERLPHQFKQLLVGSFTAAVWLGNHDVSPFVNVETSTE
jgi:hypothetical protein